MLILILTLMRIQTLVFECVTKNHLSESICPEAKGHCRCGGVSVKAKTCTTVHLCGTGIEKLGFFVGVCRSSFKMPFRGVDLVRMFSYVIAKIILGRRSFSVSKIDL